MAKKVVKKSVDEAQQQQRKKFGEKLITEERQRYMFRLPKHLPKDVEGVNCLRNESGCIVVKPDIVRKK